MQRRLAGLEQTVHAVGNINRLGNAVGYRLGRKHRCVEFRDFARGGCDYKHFKIANHLLPKRIWFFRIPYEPTGPDDQKIDKVGNIKPSKFRRSLKGS